MPLFKRRLKKVEKEKADLVKLMGLDDAYKTNKKNILNAVDKVFEYFGLIGDRTEMPRGEFEGLVGKDISNDVIRLLEEKNMLV